MNRLLKPVLCALLLANVSLAASESREFTPNDELIFAVKGAARSLAMLSAIIMPIPGIFAAMATDPSESDADLTKISNILAKGANINYQDPWGYTALIYAAYYGYPKIAAYLLQRGANKYITEKRGYHALTMAQYYVDQNRELLARNSKPEMVSYYQEKIQAYEQVVQVLQ